MGESRHVPGGEVGDMNVVAHARAVGGRIIVAKHVDARPASRCDVGQNRHQVVRDIRRRLADLSGCIGAGGIEIAQQSDTPRGVGRREVLENQLDGALGAAVDACGSERRIFRHGVALGLTVHRRR